MFDNKKTETLQCIQGSSRQGYVVSVEKPTWEFLVVHTCRQLPRRSATDSKDALAVQIAREPRPGLLFRSMVLEISEMPHHAHSCEYSISSTFNALVVVYVTGSEMYKL